MPGNNEIQIKISVGGADKASKEIQSVGVSVSGFAKSIGLADITLGGFIANLASSATTKAFSMVSDGISAVANGILNISANALNAADDLQQNRIALEVMLGPADQARSLLKDISAFAATTPFNATDLQAYSKQLIAAGFAGDQVVTTMEALGDIASGVGTDNLPFLIKALGDARTAGKFAGGELIQFRNAGVNLARIFKDKLGLSIEEVNDKIAAGVLSYQDVENVILSLGREGGKFDGLMVRQSKTMKGLISNIQDMGDQFLRTFGGITEEGDIVEGGFLDQVQKGLTDVIGFLTEHGPELKEIGAQIGAAFGQFVREILPKIIEQLPALITGFRDWLDGAIKRLPDVIKGVEKLVEAIGNVGKVFSAVKDTIDIAFQVIKLVVLKVELSITDLIARLSDANIAAQEFFGREVPPQMREGARKAWEEVNRLGKEITSTEKYLSSLGQNIGQTFSGVAAQANNATAAVQNLSISSNATAAQFGKTYATPVRKAAGGVVPGTSYSGDRVPAMLNSGEMVLTRQDQSMLLQIIRSMGGGARPNQTINANFSGGNRSRGQEINLLSQVLAHA